MPRICPANEFARKRSNRYQKKKKKKERNRKRRNKIKRDEERVSEAPEAGKGAAEKNNPI